MDEEMFMAVTPIEEIEEAEKRRNELELFRRSFAENSVDGFRQEIEDSRNRPAVPTMFPKLDAELDGGMREGLYGIGAVTSLGKTAWIMQIADSIASTGGHVLVISLEMSRNQLVARSVSRLTAMTAVLTRNFASAKSQNDISDGWKYDGYTDESKRIISDAIDEYAKIGKHIAIVEGNFNCGIDDVDRYIRLYHEETGVYPVTILDYLQILSPSDARASEKEKTDNAVRRLKQMSRAYHIPVIAISSFNRDSYAESVSMKSFKESGGIEYTCDALLGLQYVGTGEKDFDSQNASEKDVRDIEAVILKNRYGKVGRRIQYKYYSRYNYFNEV